MNKRIKLEYRKTMPKNCKKVVRGTSFGNPFKLKSHGGKYTLKKSLNLYEKLIDFILELDKSFLDELIGFDLGCFCKLENECHADILLKKVPRRRKYSKTRLSYEDKFKVGVAKFKSSDLVKKYIDKQKKLELKKQNE